MDVASKIKQMKEKTQHLDQEISDINSRIKELGALLEANKSKESKLEELKKREAELLAQLGL